MTGKKIKLGIGIPHVGTIKAQTAFSLFAALKDFPHDYNVFMKEGCLHISRQEIVEKAIEKECTHLLFVDSDMSFPKDAVVRLIERKKDIVGAHYNRRKFPPTSTVVNPKDPNEGLTTCDSVATGFMLIKLDVFKKLSKPWFFWGLDENGKTVTGEDYFFCSLAREAGFEVWCDFSIEVGHVGDYIY